jgi:phosphoglycerol transferase MdoB-like AlkP superfamily enzyme
LKFGAGWNSDDNRRWLSFVAFYAILANLPFWVACPLIGMLRNGLFCLDFAAAGVLALFVPRIFASAVLFLIIVADLICAISRTYYLPPAECLRNFGALRELSAVRLVILGTVLLIILFLAIISATLPVEKIRGVYRLRAAACLMLFVVVLASADYAMVIWDTGHAPNPLRLVVSSDSVRLSYLQRPRLSRPSLILLVHAEDELFGLRAAARAFPKDAPNVPSAAAAAIRLADPVGIPDRRQKPNLVIILVESWGLANDPSIRGGLVQPYLRPDILARYQLAQGTVPFYGPTIAGEARELCGSRMGFHLLDATRKELQGCLPNELAAQGYYSMALHGMDGHMFNRSEWYGNIGFQEEWFRGQFRQQGLADCPDVFDGTCDAAIAAFIGRRLEAEDSNPNFVYWVTLNSHLPVPTPVPLPDPVPCSVSSNLSQEAALCSWYQLVSNVHLSVAQLALGNLARPTVFAIVGDHAPPFGTPFLRNQFSGSEVPYVLLVPRRH